MSLMQVELSAETKAALERSAKLTGKAPESLVVEAVKRFLDIEPRHTEVTQERSRRNFAQRFVGDDQVREFFPEWHVSRP